MSSIDTVRGWLLERNPGITGIDPDLDLIENRVIDSLRFLEFLYFLEELTGRELTPNADTVAQFRTLRSIETSILGNNGLGNDSLGNGGVR